MEKLPNQTNKNTPSNRGKNQNIDVESQLRSLWLGRQDSNLRMPVPKTGALPLGDAPKSIQRLILTVCISCTQRPYFTVNSP